MATSNLKMECGDRIDVRELEEIMSFAPDPVASEYGLSDYLRDVSSVAGSNKILEAFAGGADQGLFQLLSSFSNF